MHATHRHREYACTTCNSFPHCSCAMTRFLDHIRSTELIRGAFLPIARVAFSSMIFVSFDLTVYSFHWRKTCQAFALVAFFSTHTTSTMSELAPSATTTPTQEATGVNLERKARKEAQKALKAQQAAQKKAAAVASAAATSSQPSASSSSSSFRATKSNNRGQTADEQLSRALAYILRHGAEKEGLKIRADGYVMLKDVLDRPRVKSVNMAQVDGESRRAGMADVRKVVEANDKKRFELTQEDDGEWWVRAVQGHSLKSVTELEHTIITKSNLHLLTPPIEESFSEDVQALRLHGDKGKERAVEVIHGTNPAAWDAILASGGLKPMTRNHIHLAKGKFGDKGVISGMRKSASRLIYVNVMRAMEDGIVFELSSNGVVLTTGKHGMLPTECFTRVEDGKGNIVWAPDCKQ